jgi:hypothetical protein
MPSPAEGWYKDPGSTLNLRYWDGATWTDKTKPLPPPSTLEQPIGESPQSWDYRSDITMGGEGPHWGLSIVTSILVFPLGLLALLFSILCANATTAGNQESATKYSSYAKRTGVILLSLLVVAFIVGFILGVTRSRQVGNDQTSANNTSAVAIADAGYYQAESDYPGGFPLTTASFTASGAATAVSYDATTNCLTVKFPLAPTSVEVTVADSSSGSSPTLGC